MAVCKFIFLVLVATVLWGIVGCGQTLHSAQQPLQEFVPVAEPEPLPASDVISSESSDSMEMILERKVEWEDPPPYVKNGQWEEVQDFYRLRIYNAAWLEEDGPRSQATDLIEALCKSNLEDFPSSHYHAEKILSALDAAYNHPVPDDEDLADLDLLLTYVFMDYWSDVQTGPLKSALRASNWYIAPPKANLAQVLQKALQDNKIKEELTKLPPSHPDYLLMKEELDLYQAAADKGGWPVVEKGKTLRKGSRGSRVIALRKRLAASGDLKASLADNNPVYDEAVAKAVTRFQKRHNLRADGHLRPDTVKALNVPLKDRILKLRLNLERWRSLPRDLGKRYIIVNIPEFRLYGFDNGREVLDMAVVVGQEFDNRATPAFSGMMESVVFRPYWNVPPGIAEKEILPRAKNNPGYLASRNYEITSGGRIRQRPGPKNSLGLIKFLFPNEFSVYLHDTPNKSLFKKHTRAFSHGCIRIERPVDLALYVFNDRSRWNEKKIRDLMNKGDSKWVNLPKQLPVYILYFTAIVKDGVVTFHEDIYGRDKVLIEALKKQMPAKEGANAHHLCNTLNKRIIKLQTMNDGKRGPLVISDRKK